MEILCFVLGLVALAISAFFAFRNRYNMKKCITSITLGILFATFCMVLPTKWVQEGENIENPVLFAAVSSVLYSFKALGGGSDIDQIETIAFSGVLKTVYVLINYAMFVSAPILASSLVLSFIGDTGDKIRYAISLAKKCYIFSEVNKNSLALAKGITRNEGKRLIVFCDSKDADKDFVAQAREMGAVLLYKPCDSIKIFKRFKSCEFCLISNNEDNNLKLAEQLLNKYSGFSNVKIITNAFIESGTNEKFLENAFKSKREENLNVELRCVDEIALFCNHLIYNYPLFNTKGNGNHISVAIVGCGRVGMRMLKTTYWAGQIDGYTLKIRVYDKNANQVREEFYRQCPGLKDEEAIGFVEADVNTLDFKKKLLEKENSLDATHIVVAMGDDQLNMSISDEIYKAYRISRNFDKTKAPEIFTRVRSQVKSNSYFENSEFLRARCMHLFGTTESVFSDKTLFNTELENMAFAVHLAYWERLSTSKDSAEYKEVRRDFETSEYDRRSSMAAALHIPAKLCMCPEIKNTGENNLTEENIAIFAKCIKEDKDLLKRLTLNEHRRWNAFMLSEGYMPATKEEMMQYSKTTGQHRDDLSMLHPCITDWDSLDEIETLFNEAYGKNKKFKFYDEEIVRNIPVIWSLAKEMNNETV